MSIYFNLYNASTRSVIISEDFQPKTDQALFLFKRKLEPPEKGCSCEHSMLLTQRSDEILKVKPKALWKVCMFRLPEDIKRISLQGTINTQCKRSPFPNSETPETDPHFQNKEHMIKRSLNDVNS